MVVIENEADEVENLSISLSSSMSPLHGHVVELLIHSSLDEPEMEEGEKENPEETQSGEKEGEKGQEEKTPGDWSAGRKSTATYFTDTAACRAKFPLGFLLSYMERPRTPEGQPMFVVQGAAATSVVVPEGDPRPPTPHPFRPLVTTNPDNGIELTILDPAVGENPYDVGSRPYQVFECSRMGSICQAKIEELLGSALKDVAESGIASLL